MSAQPTLRMHPAAAWAVLVVASLGVFLGGAELMVVAIALPAIVADFGGWDMPIQYAGVLEEDERRKREKK